MQSYAGKSSVDSVLVSAETGKILQQTGSTGQMYFRRPNRLRLDYTAPVGSRTVWSNATEIGVLDRLIAKYWTVPPQPNMEALLPVLYKQANTAACFDPLYGISKGTLPSRLGSFKLKGSGVLNGHQVLIVSAVLQGKRPSEWTWWIDKKSFLLYKVEQQATGLSQKYRVVQDGIETLKSRPVTLVLRCIFSGVTPNAAVTDDLFDFKPPAGATPQITPPDPGAVRLQ
jgi:outer membrane lipoprotein-sorting protein